MVDVKGKWAFITGASRGIGYLSAKFMAENGCNLILHARSKSLHQRMASVFRNSRYAREDEELG